MYDSAEQQDAKLGRWLTNHAAVSAHNAAAARGEHSFTLGMNRFADLSNAEYRAPQPKTQREGLEAQSHRLGRPTTVRTGARVRQDGVRRGGGETRASRQQASH